MKHRFFARGCATLLALTLLMAGAAIAGVKAMEMHQGPRPVYGGPGRQTLA